MHTVTYYINGNKRVAKFTHEPDAKAYFVTLHYRGVEAKLIDCYKKPITLREAMVLN